MRPKRTRAKIQSAPEEPMKKRIKLFLKAGNPADQDDLDLGTWLKKAEERCLRAGNLKTRLENEKLQVLEKMKRMKDEKTSLVTESGSHEDDCDESVPKGWKMSCEETPGGPSHQSGKGAPLQQINTRAPGHYCQDDEEVPEGWKEEEEMDYIDNDVPKGWKISSAEAPGGPCHQYGEGAPLQQINTWAPGQNCQDDEYEGW